MPTKEELELAIGILQRALEEKDKDQKIEVPVKKKRSRKPKKQETEIQHVIPTQEETEPRPIIGSKPDQSRFLAPIKKPGHVSLTGDPKNLVRQPRLVPFDVSPRPNLFFDNRTEHIEDSAKVAAKGVAGIGARNINVREKTQNETITVKCPVCNQLRTENSKYIYSSYGPNETPMLRCNMCATTPPNR